MLRSNLGPILLTLLAGALITVQTGVNARLRLTLSSPFQAGFISFLVGTLALLAIVAVFAPFSRGSLGGAPWWAFTGGLLGAFYICLAILMAPRLGAVALVALVITGQVTTAVVLDHFGLVGFARSPVSSVRLAGLLLIVCGVLLVLRKEGNASRAVPVAPTGSSPTRR